MKIIYISEIGGQIAASIPYNFDKEIRIGDIITKDKLWDAGEKDMVIISIEIENHIIFCTLRTIK